MMAKRDGMKGFAAKDNKIELSQVKIKELIKRKGEVKNYLARKEGESENNMQSCNLESSTSISESDDNMQDRTIESEFITPSKKLSKKARVKVNDKNFTWSCICS